MSGNRGRLRTHLNDVWSAYSASSVPVRYGASAGVGFLLFLGIAAIAQTKSPATAQPSPSFPTINGNCNFPGGTNNGTVICPAIPPQSAASYLSPPTFSPPTPGSTFLKIGPNALVEGLVLKDAEVSGFDKDIDVQGTLRDSTIEKFKSSSPEIGTLPRAYLGSMYIGRVGPARLPKIGSVQPEYGPAATRNADGTFTASVPFNIDPGVVSNLIVGIRGAGLISYQLLKDEAVVPTLSQPNNDGRILQMIPGATGRYVIESIIRNEHDLLDIAFGTWPPGSSFTNSLAAAPLVLTLPELPEKMSPLMFPVPASK
jgi:hypothetical protein